MVNDMSASGELSSRAKLLENLGNGSEFLLGLRDELTEIENVRNALKKLPTGLNAAYHQILKRIADIESPVQAMRV